MRSQEAPSRYRDPITATLGILASEWESQHRAYQAATLRALHIQDNAVRKIVEDSAAGAKALRDAIGKKMGKAVRKHPLGEWMGKHDQFPQAVHTARLLSMIGDPLRFPGRTCSNGHHVPEDFDGGACPLYLYSEDGGDPELCGADLGPKRRGTGVRSVWHYCGLHVVDGKMPMPRKGKQCTWNPKGRTCLLMPDGIATQLIKKQVSPWIDLYYESKERIARERGAEIRREIDRPRGLASAQQSSEGSADLTDEIGVSDGRPLRPFQIDQRARVIMVKAMLGDLLVEWKRLVLAG